MDAQQWQQCKLVFWRFEQIQEFVRCDLLSEEVTRILWQKFTFKIPSTTSQESKAALELIGFIARLDLCVVMMMMVQHVHVFPM